MPDTPEKKKIRESSLLGVDPLEAFAQGLEQPSVESTVDLQASEDPLEAFAQQIAPADTFEAPEQPVGVTPLPPEQPTSALDTLVEQVDPLAQGIPSPLKRPPTQEDIALREIEAKILPARKKTNNLSLDDIEGFRGKARTGEWLGANGWQDMTEMAEGLYHFGGLIKDQGMEYVMKSWDEHITAVTTGRSPGDTYSSTSAADAFFDEGVDLSDTLKGDIDKLKTFPGVGFAVEVLDPAIEGVIDSVARWGDAHNEGKFLEAVYQHPLDFVLDVGTTAILPAGLALKGLKAATNSAKAVSAAAKSGSMTAKVADRAAKITGSAEKATKVMSGLAKKAANADPLGLATTVVPAAIKKVMVKTGATAGQVRALVRTRISEKFAKKFPEAAADPFHGRIVPMRLAHDSAPKQVRLDPTNEKGKWANFKQRLNDKALGAYLRVDSMIEGIAPWEMMEKKAVAVERANKTGDRVTSPMTTAADITIGDLRKVGEAVADTKIKQGLHAARSYQREVYHMLERGFNSARDITQKIGKSEGILAYIRNIDHRMLGEVSEYMVGRRIIYDFEPRAIALKAEGDALLAKGQIDEGNLKIQESESLLQGFEMEKVRDFVHARDLRLNKDANPMFDEVSGRLQEFHNDRIDYYVDAGMISREGADAMLAKNKNYITFDRGDTQIVTLSPAQRKKFGVAQVHVEMDAKGKPTYAGDSGGGTLKNLGKVDALMNSFKGSLRNLEDPILADMALTYRMGRDAQTNVALQNIGNRVRSNPALMKDLGVELVELKNPRPPDTAGQMLRKAEKEAGSSFIQKRPEGASYSTFIQEVPEGHIRFFEGGEPRYLKITDPLLMDSLVGNSHAMAALLENNSSPSVRFLWNSSKGISSTLKNLAVRAPHFPFVNAARDTFQAGIYSKHRFIPILDSARGMARMIKKGDSFEYAEAAGVFGSGKYVNFTNRNALKDLRDQTFTNTGLQGMERFRATMMGFVDAMDRVNAVLENAPRVMEFERSFDTLLGRQKGEALADAIARNKGEGNDVGGMAAMAGLDAREITMNFERKGSNSVVNAMLSISGFDRAGLIGERSLRSKMMTGGTKFFAKGFTTLTVPAVTLWWQCKDNEDYKKLNKFEKGMSIPIPAGNGKTLYYPSMHTLGKMFATGPIAVLNEMYDQDQQGTALQILKSGLLDNVLPVGGPVMPRLVGELAVNKNTFFGNDIEPAYLDQIPKQFREHSGTSEVAKAMSELTRLAKIPGFFNPHAEASLSPLQVDHMLKGVGGRDLLKVGDILLGDATGRAAPKGQLGGIPVLEKVEKGQGTNTFWAESLSEKAVEYTKLHRTYFKDKLSDTKLSRVETSLILKASQVLGAATATSRQLHTQMAKIRKHKTYTPEQTRKKLDEVQAKLDLVQRRAVTRVNSFENRAAQLNRKGRR